MLYAVDTNGQLQPGLSQEWLLTNGMGAYCGSTIVSCNTRRYHGLLCAATLPPVGRVLALSRMGEVVRIAGSDVTHELGVNQFPANFHPRGERYLRRFSLDAYAQWDNEVDGVTISRQVMILLRRNVVVIRYIVDPGGRGTVSLRLSPIVALRDFHGLRRGTEAILQVAARERQVSVRENDNEVLVTADAGSFVQAHDWWRGHYYAIEAERGMDHIEDLFTPGHFAVEIAKPTTVTLVASAEPAPPGPIDWEEEVEKRRAAFAAPEGASTTMQRLARAAADFIVERKCPDGSVGATVIAGYPWFADWGRDTMISLPALFLKTGRFKQAARVLSLFAEYVSEGMIPNRFDDYTNEPSYNTVDASLWFIHACFEYLKATGDNATFEQKLLPACRAIVKGYSTGTRYHIKMDPADGLITQGDPSTQLTWMDAKRDNVAFTPRQGKAVEINALWYHGLRLLGENELADKVQQSFVKTFWINPFRGLCDVVTGTVRDTKIRPNQIFAVSLPNSPLSEDQQFSVVEVVRRELLTPYGLRTLAPGDPQFHAKFTGDPFHRDAAYHNGTIWPWLIGAFLDAHLRVNKRSPEAVAQAKQWLQPLLDAMVTHGCIGQISEVYEAEPPHRPAGCFAQAWSVAEVLRLAGELKM